MKKRLLSLLTAILVAVSSLFAQNLLLPLVKDSSASYYYDSFSGTEQFSSFSTFSYNSDKLPLRDYYTYNYSSGPVFYREDYTYTNQKQLENATSIQSAVSINGPWVNWLKTDYTYDAQGRNDYYLGQLGNGNSWSNYYQETFWFDDSSPASDSSLYMLWDAATASWTNYRQYFNYYRPTGDLSRHHEDEWKTTTADWRFLQQQDYTYYPDGKIRTKKSISYDVNQTSLIQIDSFLYRQDGQIDSSFLSSVSSSSNITSYTVAKYSYDADGNIAQILALKKNDINSPWRPSYLIHYQPGDGYYSDDHALERYSLFNESIQGFEAVWERTKDYTDLGNNQFLYIEDYRQRNGQGVLAPSRLDSIWYHLEIVSTGTPISKNKADCQFANPFVNGNNIICNATDQQSPLNIRIMNVSGQIVAQKLIKPGDAWSPGANWPTGLYFLTAWQNGRYLGERRMVVE